MDGEQESIAPVEAETPIEQEIEQEQPVSLDAPEGEVEAETDGGEPVQEPEDDFEEFEWNGKQIKAPKGLKDNLLMHADYTKKTQEVAETRRELEQRAERIAQQAKASEEEMHARAALIGIEDTLKQYAQVDWDAWEAQDPLAAQQGWRKFQQLQASRGEYANQITQAAEARNREAQQDLAKRIDETQRYARENIKGWTPETDTKVLEFAASEGITKQALQEAINPTIYRILHMAMLGSQALQKSAAAPKLVQKSAPQPLTTVTAKANPSARKSLSEMSMEEYAAARKAGRGG